MPVYDVSDGSSPTTTLSAATRIHSIFAESSSEAAALPNGERALTPILAGSISGTLVVVAWVIAAVYHFVKSYKRKQKFKAAGRMDLINEAPKPQAFIVPPDPAVLQGQRQPGERVYVEKKSRHKRNGKGKEKALQMLKMGAGVNSDEKATQSSPSVLKTLDEPLSNEPSMPDLPELDAQASASAPAVSGPGIPSDRSQFDLKSIPASPTLSGENSDGLPAVSDFAYPPGPHDHREDAGYQSRPPFK